MNDTAVAVKDDVEETLTAEQVNGVIISDPAVREYIALDRVYAETVKPLLEKMSELKADIAARYKIGTHFQDTDGTVFEIDAQEWKSVRMETFAINRTRREGEAKGSLSEKRAKELGYTLPAK
jgi:hypothetical protein